MQELIKKFDLKPHPEGGYFGEVFRSSKTVNSSAHAKQRHALTHIYFLLEKGQISRFHRVLHDEVWNFYAGAPLKLIQVDASATMTIKQPYKTHEIIIGDGESYAHVVPAEYWQAAESTGDYSLVGCSVAPGFDFEDFSFMQEAADVEWIKKRHPDWLRFI